MKPWQFFLIMGHLCLIHAEVSAAHQRGDYAFAVVFFVVASLDMVIQWWTKGSLWTR